MIKCYNFSNVTIKDSKADSVAVKGKNTAVQVYSFNGDCVVIDTTDYDVGDYYLQFFSNNQIIKTDVMRVQQNLKYAPDDYDPRSKSEIILEAIEAYLGGVASHQQKRVKVGDKQIEYSSFDELQKWRDFYQKKVKKQHGKKSSIRCEKIIYRG